jgi:hypothetical protein
MLTAVGLVTILGSAGSVRGDLALDFTGGLASTPSSAATEGWSFTVNTAITVGSLGIWDESSHVLNGPHDVGLWTGTGTLLATTTITSTSSTPVLSTSGEGQWLFNAITPTFLLSGEYVIASHYIESDPDFARLRTTATTITQITYGTFRDEISSTLTFPSVSDPALDDGSFGPNFLTTTVAVVPEPSTALVAGIGAVGLLAYWYRQRRDQQRQAAA